MLKPQHPCARPGCPHLTFARYCGLHWEKRPSTSSKAYDWRWARYSRRFLSANSFCCDPFARHRGQIVVATVTGHRRAHKGDQQLFWNPANHSPLCNSCNAYQCAKEEGGFGNRIVKVERSVEPCEKRT